MDSGIKRITLTGATGFLGSSIMTGLLKKGYSVNVAGRAKGNLSLHERIIKILDWYNAGYLAGNVTEFKTDFSKPFLGLSGEDYDKLCAGSPPVIHCASDTSFAERNRSRVMESNVYGLKNILELVHESNTSCFHYISTAYASGAVSGKVPELPVAVSEYTNVYEESKAIAEREISQFCDKFKIPYTIIRPAIVYGDSGTGHSLRFNALYYPVKSIGYIRDIYLNDLRNNAGARSAEWGIFICEDGYLNLPLRIYLPHKGLINLIPLEYFTESALSVVENPAPGMIYNIAADSPPDMELLLKFTGKFLQIRGLEVVYAEPDKDMLRNPAEELFDHFMKPYRPYLSDRREFVTDNTQKVTGGLNPPEMSYEIFERCMNYAVSVEWGKLFQSFI